MICTPCQQEVEIGMSAIFGVDRGDGTLRFGWTCCHKPVGDVAVVIASTECLEKWLREYPQYTHAIGILFANHGHGLRHDDE